MTSDPFGILARASAASLMWITPEYWKVRAARTKGAGSVRAASTDFAIKPETISIDGLKIRHARADNASGPTILFLSPLPQSIYCYDKIWSALLGEATMIALDLPGFGGSEGGMDCMTFEAQSAFLEKYVSETGIADFHIVAPDVAMPVAMHYVMHRNHKAKSIMIGDGPGILPSSDGSLIKKMVYSSFWQLMIRLNGARVFLSSALQIGYLHYSPTEAELLDYLASYEGRVGQVVAYFASYPEGLKTLDPNIDTLSLPVHVFWGDSDAFLMTDNAERLHQRLPKSQLTIFKNCGHFSYQDKGEEFTQVVRDWVNGGYSSDLH